MTLDRSYLQNLSKTNLKVQKTTPKDGMSWQLKSSPLDQERDGERIESGIKRGKFAQANNGIDFAKKAGQEKKKREANAVLIDLSNPYGQGKNPYTTQIILNKPGTSASTDSLSLPKVNAASAPNTQSTRPAQQSERGRRNMITITPLKPLEPSYTKSYDPNAKCDYHTGAIGHPTKKCWGFKHKVQDLIEGGWLAFKEKEPNVNNNPLPIHGRQSINSLSHEGLNQESDEIGSSRTHSTQVAVIE
ncbi:hypothetical protein CR513_25245, partial [Mucuna pruriens]